MSTTEPAMLLLDDETVARYLRDHPDFFQRYPSLVSEFSLPHESGSAVSLVERQVSILRERNIELRKRFAQLVHAAEANEVRFAKTRNLTLAWLDAADLPALDAVLKHALAREFGADFAVCYYRSRSAGAAGTYLRPLAMDQLPPLYPLTEPGGISCGMLRQEELAVLFGGEPAGDGSAVLVQLEHGPLKGLLGIGSRDPNRFTADMGTLFVRYVGDVLARVLARLTG